MHPFLAFVGKYGISTYEEFQSHEKLLSFPKFQKVLPRHLMWSNSLSTTLQRGFAAGVPLPIGLIPGRFVDGPDTPVTPKGWMARKSGECEYTLLSDYLIEVWGIDSGEEILSTINTLLHTMEPHVLSFSLVRGCIGNVISTDDLEERAERVEELRPQAASHLAHGGIEAEEAVQMWDSLTQPFLEEDAALVLPAPSRLPTTLVAWGIRRASALAWLGARTSRLSIEELTEPLHRLSALLNENYDSWQDFQDAYHVARRYAVEDSAENYDDQIIGAWMLRHGPSPWRVLPLNGSKA